METISTLPIEHIVIASNQPYEKVLEALKTRMGSIEDWKEMTRKLGSIDLTSTSWEQIVQIIETHLGTHLIIVFTSSKLLLASIRQGIVNRFILRKYSTCGPFLFKG